MFSVRRKHRYFAAFIKLWVNEKQLCFVQPLGKASSAVNMQPEKRL